MSKKITLEGLDHFKDKENAMVASEFSASKSYAIGEYVYYKGTLYKFKAAHAAGAWTNADVDAVKLADDVSVLKESIRDTVELYGVNLFNPEQLLKAYGWLETDGIYSGKVGSFYNAFRDNTNGLTIDGGFKENTQYSVRLRGYVATGTVASGNTLQIRVLYTDGTDNGVVYFAVVSDFQSKTFITAANKTVEKIYADYSNGNSANNMFYITDVQIAEGKEQPTYQAYQHTAIDLSARAENSETETNLFGSLKNTEKVMDVKWKRGAHNANGNISSGSGDNYTVAILPNTVNRIELIEASAQINCYNDSGYLGRIGTNGNLTTQSGNAKIFSDAINMSELFTKYNATYVAIMIFVSGTSITTDAQAVASGKEHCIVYTQENADYDFVPPYFITEIDTAIENAKTDIGACGKDGFSFIFTTDNHWNHNDGHSPAIIKAVQKATKIQDVVLGGDMIDGSDDKAHELELLQSVVRKFDSADYRLHYVFGNHDSNTVGQTTTPALHFSQNEVYMATQKPQEYTSKYSADGFTDYYFDDETTKTRVIVVDSKIEGVDLTTAQITWFNETLASTPTGYRIIVIMHIWYGASSIASQGQAISDAVDAWNADHDTKVVALFGGHTHADAEHTTAGGVPLIITTCDIPTATLFENADGQAVDVITVNYTAKKINCRRIGRGSDREVTW